MANKDNTYESIEEISLMLHHILVGIEKGTHREKYLDYEIYGCVEKTKGNHKKIRISEEVYSSNKEAFDNLKVYYKDDEDLKHIPGWLKEKYHAEHIFPRSMLREKLKELDPKYDEKNIQTLLEKVAKGILITKEEEMKLDKETDNLKNSMPENWESVDDRLKAKDIVIHQENGKDVYYTISNF